MRRALVIFKKEDIQNRIEIRTELRINYEKFIVEEKIVKISQVYEWYEASSNRISSGDGYRWVDNHDIISETTMWLDEAREKYKGHTPIFKKVTDNRPLLVDHPRPKILGHMVWPQPLNNPQLKWKETANTKK